MKGEQDGYNDKQYNFKLFLNKFETFENALPVPRIALLNCSASHVFIPSNVHSTHPSH